MRVTAKCPDCETELVDIAGIPRDFDDEPFAMKISLGKLISVKAADGPIGYCTHCERLWEVQMGYDEVFAGKHQGDPK